MSHQMDEHVEKLGAAIHRSWREKLPSSGRGGPFDVAWEDLSEEQKQPAIAAARRIPAALKRIGLRLETGEATAEETARVLQYIEERMEVLALDEHKAWSSQKQETGWTYGPVRDDLRKLHPMLVPYDALPEPEKEKDRAIIRNYPTCARMAGLKILSDN